METEEVFFQLSLCRTTPGPALACFLLDPKAFYTEDTGAMRAFNNRSCLLGLLLPKTKRPKYFLKISVNWTKLVLKETNKPTPGIEMNNFNQSGFAIRIGEELEKDEFFT